MNPNSAFEASNSSWTGRAEFEELLRDLFSDPELRIWLKLTLDVEEAELPGSTASLKEVVHRATDVLLNHGLIEDSFFEALIKTRPRRQAEIDAVWAVWTAERRPRNSVRTERPRFSNPGLQLLSDALSGKISQRRQLLLHLKDTTDVDQEILRLRRKIRQGPQLRPGDYLHQGRFLLRSVIGSGGFATIWNAYDCEVENAVAVKVLHPQQSENNSVLERFRRGARKTSLLAHPNIARIVRTAFEDDGYHAYVMELISGGDLRDRAFRDGFSESRLVEIFIQVCEGLHYSHRHGLIHRDIKPSNILLDANETPKLADFDQLKGNDTTGGTVGGMGTVLYTAPELWNDASAADERTDVYSLGMSLLSCLSRRDPEIQVMIDRANYIKAIDASPRLKQLIVRTISPVPEERPATPEAMGRLLGELSCAAPERGVSGAGSLASEFDRFVNNCQRYLSSDNWYQDAYRASADSGLIFIKLDDICKIQAGAIVCGVSRTGNGGVLGRNIAKAGGPSGIHASEPGPRLSPGEVFVTPGHSLGVKYVLYVVQDDSVDTIKNHLAAHVSLLVANTIRAADRAGVRSIAYPLLLTGVVGVARDRILPILFKSIQESLITAASVEQASIVIYPYAQAIGHGDVVSGRMP